MLPDNGSVPPPQAPDLDLSKGTLADVVPGWADVRLLAPRAELRLLLCGGSDLIDPHRRVVSSFLMSALYVVCGLLTGSHLTPQAP